MVTSAKLIVQKNQLDTEKTLLNCPILYKHPGFATHLGFITSNPQVWCISEVIIL